LQVARALDHIHAKKIVHRDIKPENIHIDAEGKVTLMDFGIAKIQGMNLTRTGFTLGTPYYMAPEQVMGQPLTAATDVYAFGILMFELFAGRKPIDGSNVEIIFQKILNEPIDVGPLQARAIPPGVMELVWRCTQKQPAQRPPNFAGVVQDLERILAGGAAPPISPQPPRQQQSPPQMPSPMQNPGTADGPARGGIFQNQFVLMVLGALGAAALVFGVYECLVLTHVL
jgi:serine/threonine protein kinase